MRSRIPSIRPSYGPACPVILIPYRTRRKDYLITHHPQPNSGIAKRQGSSVLEPSEGCLLDPSPLFQPAFQPAATCQGRVQRARSGGLQGLGKVRMAEDGA